MKLSSDTMAILKNYAGINSNVFIQAGNVIKTQSVSKYMHSEVTVAENFPVTFGVWDLNRLLATLSMFKDPELNFTEDYVTISGPGMGLVTYYYTDPKILHYPQKNINFPGVDVEFDLSEEDINNVLKASAVLQLPDLSVERDGENILFKLHDKKSTQVSNTYTINVGKVSQNIIDSNNSFKFVMKLENFKIVPGSYKVQFSKRKISKFEHKSLPLVYYIAAEQDSTWT